MSRIGAVSGGGARIPDGNTGLAPLLSAADPSVRSASASPPIPPVDAKMVATGFYINAAGDVLTIWPEIQGCRRILVQDRYGVREAQVAAGNAIRSMAILTTGESVTRYAIFREKDPAMGELVVEYAYPLVDTVMLPLTQGSGVVRSRASPDGVQGVLQIAILIDGRTPGGPLVGRDGKVVAIGISKLDQRWPVNASYAIGSGLIRRFTAASGVTVDARPAAGVASALGSPADYVVSVICFG